MVWNITPGNCFAINCMGTGLLEIDDGVDIDVVVSQSNLLSDTFSISPQKVAAVKMFQ